METTLNKIRSHSPCSCGWEKLLKTLGKTRADDEPLPLLTILASNGLDDALWCLRAVDGQNDVIRKLACDFALDVAHFWDMPTLVRDYLTTQNESIRAAAGAAAAEAAEEAARAARAAAGAAWAAGAAARAAGAAAGAARAAARAAAWAAAWAAAGAAGAAAWAAARERQTIMFKSMLSRCSLLNAKNELSVDIVFPQK